MPAKKPIIFIEVEGGLVQDIFADTDVEVRVLDRDVEGADEDEITTADGREATVCHWTVAQSDVSQLVKETDSKA